MNELLDAALELQNMLVGGATGHGMENPPYRRLRQLFIDDAALRALLPQFVRVCRDHGAFWNFIQPKFKSYAERRTYIREEFEPLLAHLESRGQNPSDTTVAEVLAKVDAEHVAEAWTKALARRHADPEGAITMARTLLESVCKHVLDDMGVEYADDADLPRLYRATAKALTLAPDQQTEDVFRRILGGATAIVEGIGSLRNKLSDAHGRSGRLPVKPKARHAAWVVNLAGSTAQFLLETWQERKASD